MKETIIKAAKGAGETISKSGVVKKTKSLGSGINKHILEDVSGTDKQNSLLYKVFPKRIKQKIAVPIVLGVGAIGAGTGIYNMQNRNDIGEMSGGSLSHMTSNVVSPRTEELQKGKYEDSNIMYGSKLRNSGAEGDLVFALHNMR